MPLEIEIKLKVESHEQVLRRLVEIGGERVGRVRETNIFFDRADRSLRKADCGLRVRLTRGAGEAGPRALLTFKGPAGATGLYAREAFDLKVTPVEQVVPMILAMGFEQMFLFEKDRESWRVGECLVELDTLPHFGKFVEIEGPSEEVVRAVQNQLGLGHLKQHDRSYIRMVSEYLEGHGRGEKDLRFGNTAE
jgi:adenylate cyclase, class 2